MAKHCDVCNQEYPDNLSACPHCAAARTPNVAPGSESDINLEAHLMGGEHPGEAPDHSSVVDLGKRGKATHHAIPPGSESDIQIELPPAQRVPDTNSGVTIHRVEEPSDSSVVEWAALVQDAGRIDESGVRVDSPSDEDLLAKAAKPDSSSDIGLPHADAPAGDSGLRIVQHSEADVVLSEDSGSRIYPPTSATPMPETSGVRIVAKSEPDVIHGGPGSEPDVLPPALGDDESSAINLGGLPPKNAPADLALASDALESGTSGVDVNKSDASAGDSVEAFVELPQDSGTSHAPLPEDSGSGPSSEQSGLDLTMLSGGSSEGSSILPERPRRVQPPAERPARKAPPTHHSIHEHFAEDDDSAVQLGAMPPARSEEEEAAASSHAKAEEQERRERKASPERPSDAGQSGRIYPPKSRSLPMVLAGTVIGLVLGAGGTAGVMSLSGGNDSKAKSSANTPNPNPVAAVDQGGKEWTTRFPDKGPEDVAKMIDELDAGKKEAEKNVAVQADAVKAEQTKNANLSNDLKATATKSTELAEKANAAEKKVTDLAAAAEKAKTAEAAARKQAEEAAAAVKELKTKVTESETASRTSAEQMAKLKDQLKAADDKNAASAKQVEVATEARKQTESVLEAAVKKLKEGKYLKADASTADVARGVEQAITAAKTADPSGKLATIQAEVASLQSKLAKSESALATARKELEEKPRQVTQPSVDVQESIPLLAEAAYMAGVQSYWSGAYERAEGQFLNAIRNDGRDARYHYYLGLTRLALQKRSAAQHDFERGADLERQGRPSRVAVNAALERIQGGVRQTVESYRR
jgi:hypothetical protein